MNEINEALWVVGIENLSPFVEMQAPLVWTVRRSVLNRPCFVSRRKDQR